MREENWFRLLVNAKGANVKVSVGKRAGVIIHKVDARAGAPGPTEGASRPITTKSQVDDNAIGRELFIDIALRIGEECSRGTLWRRTGVRIRLWTGYPRAINSPSYWC